MGHEDVRIDRYENLVDTDPELYATALRLREAHLHSEEDAPPHDPRDSDRGCVHFVARRAGEVVGTVQYEPASRRLRQMVVAPGFRGAGLGLRLVGRIVEEARARGERELLVHAWDRARGFYERAGFVHEGEVYTSRGVLCQRLRMALGDSGPRD